MLILGNSLDGGTGRFGAWPVGCELAVPGQNALARMNARCFGGVKGIAIRKLFYGKWMRILQSRKPPAFFMQVCKSEPGRATRWVIVRLAARLAEVSSAWASRLARIFGGGQQVARRMTVGITISSRLAGDSNSSQQCSEFAMVAGCDNHRWQHAARDRRTKTFRLR